ncbi:MULTISPECIES: amino acid adenylation domain-containing protein [unclassified Streptomyces]|uniref:amino acid adenylation domain-containing protein n=1 Tax=unclassified Streptomyces TaxID=2593676 RepID=UPI0033B489E5
MRKTEMAPTGLGETHENRTLTSILTSTVGKAPTRRALTLEGETLSYARLNNWSLAVADALRTHGIRRGDRVALRIPPSMEAIAAILAILHCGAAYVPLDTRNPPTRNDFILQDSAVTALVGDTAGLSAPGLPVITVDEVAALRDSTAPRALPAESGPRPHDTAYVIYTSGTTGRPKGVPVRHESVAALLESTSRLFEFTAEDKWLLFHSLAFDFSVWEIWGPLSTGAELVILPHWSARTTDGCLRAVQEHGITVLNQTPTAFGAFADAALHSGHDLTSLRYIVFGGEKLTPPVLRPWAKQYGTTRPRLVNMYGITETTVHATFHTWTEQELAGEDSVIGHPLPGLHARIVTDDGHEADAGQPGELWLAGTQVSQGYLHREELNAERFPTAPDPTDGTPRRYYRSGDLVTRRPDGDLLYHGRADLQVKLRGHRVELSDVETAVRDHPAVLDAVVFVHEFAPGDSRLVCAYATPPGGETPDARALRAHVKERLPSYMHPGRYFPLPQLPRTVNGKVDRTAVVQAFRAFRERK